MSWLILPWRALLPLALQLLACATPAGSYRIGIDPATPLPAALAACSRSPEPDECTSVAVRNHPQEAGVEHCRRIASGRWRAECHFSLAEPLAGRGDRWGALIACGGAGAFYDECLYHAWTFDLQRSAMDIPRTAAGPDPAALRAALDAARPAVAFWAALSTARTRDGSPLEELLWADWWYAMWWYSIYPGAARLSACAALDPADRPRCEAGTRRYVTRIVAEPLLSARQSPARDRLCRGGESRLAAVHPDQWEPDLQPDALQGLALGCGGARTWTPVFGPRDGGPGMLPAPGSPGSPPAPIPG